MESLLVYSSKRYFEGGLQNALASLNLASRIKVTFVSDALTTETAPFARGYKAVAIFVNDDAKSDVLELLAAGGTQIILCMCAGYNMVDLKKAKELNISVTNVPAYSPHAVAEFAVGLLLTLNRKIHRAYNRTREQNFNLEGLMGFDLYGKTVSVIGCGKIGGIFCRIMHGFGSRVLGYDPYPNHELEAFTTFVSLEEALAQGDVVALFVPLFPETHHIINEANLALMKDGAYLVNVSRGGLVDSRALIRALKTGKLGGVALDVYEEEQSYFYQDHSERGIQDDKLSRLLSWPNVLISSHMAFFTTEAVQAITETTLTSFQQHLDGIELTNRVQFRE